MDQDMKDRLEQAVEWHVDGLDTEALVYLVSELIWSYYINEATEDELEDFVLEMEKDKHGNERRSTSLH